MVRERNFEQLNQNLILMPDRMFPLYIITGSKNFLIDSGSIVKAREFAQRIPATLEELGIENPVIHTLILTHTHWDHTGAASELQKKFNFDVVCSARGEELLQKDKVVQYINRMNQDHKKLENDTSSTQFEKLERLVPVKEGDRIMIDDFSYLEVYETPGHTRCSVSYLLQPWKILFPGDATGVTEQTGVLRPLFLSGYIDYENSILKIMSLQVEVLAFPHNRLIKGKERVREYLEFSLNRAREIKGRILGFLEDGMAVPIIVETLYKTEFTKPTVMGPREALTTNLEAMVNAIRKEFCSAS